MSTYPKKIPGESNAAYGKPTARKRTNRCPTCKQDMRRPPHDGVSDCPQCGQGIISQRLQRLAQAAARLSKAERLVKRWLREADSFDAQLREVTAPTRRCDTLQRCARELSRILKP